MNEENRNKKRGFIFSATEIRKYYEHIQNYAVSREIDFSTCYLGQGEKAFFENQDLWSNKIDCCNSIGKVKEFKRGSVGIGLEKVSQDIDVTSFSYKILSWIMKKLGNS